MARIRTSGILRNPRTWPPPMLPTPIWPSVMRSLGGVVCDLATTCLGTIIGATTAPVADSRNSRRFTREGFFDDGMVHVLVNGASYRPGREGVPANTALACRATPFSESGRYYGAIP